MNAEPPTIAHGIVVREGLLIWKHLNVEGVNVYDEALKDELVEAGCTTRSFWPDERMNPQRRGWEVVLPKPDPPLQLVTETEDDA